MIYLSLLYFSSNNIVVYNGKNSPAVPCTEALCMYEIQTQKHIRQLIRLPSKWFSIVGHQQYSLKNRNGRLEFTNHTATCNCEVQCIKIGLTLSGISTYPFRLSSQLSIPGILAHTSPKEEIAAHQAGIEERISDFPQETSRGRSKRKTEDQFIVHQNIRS